MFARYTQKARRAMFFARNEACQFNTPTIQMEHLLFGLLQEDEPFIVYCLQNTSFSIEWIRRRIKEQKTISSKDFTVHNPPLSDESRHAINFAQEEADQFRHEHISTKHLFLGLLREQNNISRGILYECMLDMEKVRELILKLYEKDEGGNH